MWSAVTKYREYCGEPNIEVLRQHLPLQRDQEGLPGGGDVNWILSDMLSKAFFQKMGTAFPMERVTCTKAWKQETD